MGLHVWLMTSRQTEPDLQQKKTSKLPVLCAQLLLVALGAKRLQLSPG
jgi:hypothetical protein